MARPVSNKEKRIRKISIYLTQSEFDQLETSLTGMEKTRFIVDAINQKIKRLNQKVDDEDD